MKTNKKIIIAGITIILVILVYWVFSKNNRLGSESSERLLQFTNYTATYNNKNSDIPYRIALEGPKDWIMTNKWISSDGVDYSCNQSKDICSLINYSSIYMVKGYKSGFTVSFYSRKDYPQIENILRNIITTQSIGGKTYYTDGGVQDVIEPPGGSDPQNWSNPTTWTIRYVVDEPSIDAFIVVNCGGEISDITSINTACHNALQTLNISKI